MKLYNKSERTIEFKSVLITPKKSVELSKEDAAYLLKLYKFEFSNLDEGSEVLKISSDETVEVEAETEESKAKKAKK